MSEFGEGGISREDIFGIGKTETAGDANAAKAIEQETTEGLAKQVEHMFANTATLAEKSFEIKGNTENT